MNEYQALAMQTHMQLFQIPQSHPPLLEVEIRTRLAASQNSFPPLRLRHLENAIALDHLCPIITVKNRNQGPHVRWFKITKSLPPAGISEKCVAATRLRTFSGSDG